MVFTIQYFNGTSWVTVPNALFSQIVDELNGQLELDFIIPNTSANLTFVQSNQQIQLLWGTGVIFSGLLMAYTATFTQITCTVYNNTFEVMQKRQITGAYNNVAANTVLAAICAASGMTAGSCPTTAVSIQFNSTDCLTAAQNLAALLNQNIYSSGSTVIIGVKGNQTPTAITVDTQSQVNFDRSKTAYAGVIIRGVSPTGQVIIGTAGSVGAGNNTITLTNNSVTSQASLNALAAAYLQSLAQTNSGCPLEADISQTAALNSGDLVTISNGSDLGLSGNYAIYRITKNLTKSTLEIVTPAGAFLALINATSSINGVVAKLANASAALQTMPDGCDPNTSGMYVTLADNLGDVASLMLGNNTLLPVPSSGFPASFLTFNSSYLTYIIPSVANQNGSAATATITPQSGSPYTAPMIGLGTYKYPFLWVDQVFCYTDFLNCLESSAITLLCPLNTGTIGSATVGSSGQLLQSQGSGAPPKWVTITTTLGQMPLGTSGYFLEGQGSSAPVYAQVTFTLLGGTISTAQLGTSVTPATLSGSGAVPSGWTLPYGQISNCTSMPIQFSQLTGLTSADPVFDSVNCTNTSAAIKISPSSNPSAPYLVMVGNYTISSTAYNILNTYAYPLYITGTAVPILYVNGNVTVNGIITATFSGNVTGNCSGSSGSCTGNAATATNATELNGQLASYYAAASSLPNQALNTTSDAVFDSVLCTNASAAIKIGVYGGATYLVMNGNYTIGSTVYNVLNTYGNPLYITGTANPIVYINGNLTVTGTISGSIAWNGGTVANAVTAPQVYANGANGAGFNGWNLCYYISNGSHGAIYNSTGTNLFGLHSNGQCYWAHGSSYTMILDTAGDLTTYGWIVSSGYHQIGTRGGGANSSGYPQIFCRTDSVSGCTIQFGASGQRLDVVDYAWTVDLLLLDQSGNMTVSNSVTATGYGRLGSVGFENSWGSIWSDCSTSMSIIAIDSTTNGMMIVGSYIGSTRKIGMWDFVQINGGMNVTGQCEASNFWVSGPWLNSSSTLYLGGASGAAVTMYMNGNVNPISDNAYGLGSGSNRWAGISCVTAYVAGSVEILGTSYSNAIFGNGFFGTGNGGIQWYDGAFNIMTNGNWFYYRGSWGGGVVFSIDSIGDVSCGGLSCGAINVGGNILPKSGGSYYCGSYSYPWQIVDTQYLYCNVINSLTAGITIYGGAGSCGTSSSYWNYVYSAYIYYIHAPSAFNELLHDEFNEKINFDLIRNIKLKGDTIDPDCIKHLKNKDGFYESSTMDGWHLCVQQLIVKKLDEQEIINDELTEELDKARMEIDHLRLRLDELTQKLGGD